MMFTKHHDFCNDVYNESDMWPPISAKQVLMGKPGEGCDEVCLKKGEIPVCFVYMNKIMRL